MSSGSKRVGAVPAGARRTLTTPEEQRARAVAAAAEGPDARRKAAQKEARTQTDHEEMNEDDGPDEGEDDGELASGEADSQPDASEQIRAMQEEMWRDRERYAQQMKEMQMRMELALSAAAAQQQQQQQQQACRHSRPTSTHRERTCPSPDPARVSAFHAVCASRAAGAVLLLCAALPALLPPCTWPCQHVHQQRKRTLQRTNMPSSCMYAHTTPSAVLRI